MRQLNPRFVSARLWQTHLFSVCVCAALLMVLPSTAAAQNLYPQETESFMINYMTRSKDAATATLLSMGPGFGAGHFYAEQNVTGIIMMAGQTVGVGMLIAGPKLGGDSGKFIGIGGAVIFAGFKIADMYLAPFSAARFNRALAQGLKIKSLVARVGGGGGSHRGSKLAYGLAIELPWGGTTNAEATSHRRPSEAISR